MVREELNVLSNQLGQARASLEQTETEAKVAVEKLQGEISRRDLRITSLESERDDLSKRMTDLNVSITTAIIVYEALRQRETEDKNSALSSD